MSKAPIFVLGALLLAGGAALWRGNPSPVHQPGATSGGAPQAISSLESVTDGSFEVKRAPPQAVPMCPWREPEADLKQFFPTATRYEAETHVLSGLRMELAERLGRTPTGDENALRLYHVWRETNSLGGVLTRRVKGQYGAIELVLGVEASGRVCGLRLQRLREPEEVARALQDAEWLGAFAGKYAENAWKIGDDIPRVPEAAQISAEAIVEGVRSALLLLAVAGQAGAPKLAQHP